MVAAAKHDDTTRDSTREAAWSKFDASLRDLIALAHSGSVDAFDKLYLTSAHWLLSRIRRLVNDGQAEDVLAEVYIQAWRSLHTFDASRGAATAWLSMIARSRALDHLRHEKSRPTSDALDETVACEACDEPDSRLNRAQHARLVHSSLKELNREERLVVGLAYFKDYTQTEIAASTGYPIGTVKSLMTRAQRKLRTRLTAAEAVESTA